MHPECNMLNYIKIPLYLFLSFLIGHFNSRNYTQFFKVEIRYGHLTKVLENLPLKQIFITYVFTSNMKKMDFV